jgi:hypothetical protein
MGTVNVGSSLFYARKSISIFKKENIGYTNNQFEFFGGIYGDQRIIGI